MIGLDLKAKFVMTGYQMGDILTELERINEDLKEKGMNIEDSYIWTVLNQIMLTQKVRE